MSIDREICDRVQAGWKTLYPSGDAPSELCFMKVQGKTSNNAAVIAMIYDASTRHPVAVTKIPRNPEYTIGIEREYAAMQHLDANLGQWDGAQRIPFQGFIELISGVPVLVQRAANGYALVRDMVSQEKEERIYADVLPWLLEFHTRTATDIVLDDEHLQQLVRGPVQCFIDSVAKHPEVRVPDSLANYLERLPALVKGAKLKLCAQHGDFNAHNLVVRCKSTSTLDFTVIDWEDYRESWLPVMDINHFFISNSKLLDMTLNAEQAFSKFILQQGWYQDLYINAVNKYQAAGIIDADILWKLSPLYMTEICLSLMEPHRHQHHTLNVWIDRATAYIDKFPLFST